MVPLMPPKLLPPSSLLYPTSAPLGKSDPAHFVSQPPRDFSPPSPSSPEDGAEQFEWALVTGVMWAVRGNPRPAVTCQPADADRAGSDGWSWSLPHP